MEQGWVIEVDPDGSFHDLEAIAEDVRREYFPEIERLEVRWGRKIGRRARQSIRLGSYDSSTRMVRIHPLLDTPKVPAWFIQSIIHHEYLHRVLGPAHNRRFHRHETRFRYYRESKMWLHRHLPMLLGRRPRPARRSVRRPPSDTREVQTALFGEP